MLNIFKKKQQSQNSNAWVFGILLVAAAAGLIASFVLTLDKMEVLRNPDAILSCTINLVLDCSRVMSTWQSSLFGFPNMLIGMMAFPVLIAFAIMMLSGVKFPRPILLVAEIGIALGTLFSYWLFFESVFAIQILCPWCLLVTFSSTLILATMTYFNLRENTFNFKKKTNEKVQKFLKNGYFQLVAASWIVILVATVFLKFGDSLFA